MTLLTAHKILISAALALGLFYALWELNRYSAGDGPALLRAVVAGAITVAVAFYLRWVWVTRPTDPTNKETGA
jgi:hypothetical protein